MFKKLSLSFLFVVTAFFSFMCLSHVGEVVDERVKVGAPNDDDDDDGVFETEDGVMFLELEKLN